MLLKNLPKLCKVFIKSLFLFLASCFTYIAQGQTVVTAVSTSYNAASNGTTYVNNGALNSPLSGNSYTYNFGNLSGTTNNDEQLNSFSAGGILYNYYTINGAYVKIRRVNNSLVSGI